MLKKIKLIPFFPNILRRRIIHGYSVLLFIIMGAIVVTVFYNLHIESKAKFLLKINDLRSYVLDMRRTEKNYLLYGNKSDYDKNKIFWQKAMTIVQNNKSKLIQFIPEKKLLSIEKALTDYGAIIDSHYLRASGKQVSSKTYKNHNSLEQEMRNKGKEIVDFSHFIYRKEYDYFLDFLFKSRLIIISSFLPVIIIAIFMGKVMVKKIVEPIKLVESKARRISKGDFTEIPVEKSRHTQEIATLLDVLNKMSLELQKRQEQLVRSEKLASLGTLISGITHELNNPLSNISTSAQILNEELEGSDIFFKKELLTKINEQTDRARDIIRSLLEFSRPTKFDKKLMNLKKLFDETLVLIKSDIPSKIELVINVPEEVMIKADKQTIQQVLMNLVINAVQSIPEGQKGRVSINAWNNREKGSIGITIRDTGVGIESENISKIFDPFFTTKEAGKGFGLGLGLYIVHSIIERLGGIIEVKSIPGQGSVFIIHLPLGEIRYGV